MLYARCLDYNGILTLKLSTCNFSTKGILFNSNFFHSSFARILKDCFWWTAFGGLYFSYFSIMSFRKIQLWLLQSKHVKTALQTALEKNSYKKPVSIKWLLLGNCSLRRLWPPVPETSYMDVNILLIFITPDVLPSYNMCQGTALHPCITTHAYDWMWVLQFSELSGDVWLL